MTASLIFVGIKGHLFDFEFNCDTFHIDLVFSMHQVNI